MTHKEYADSLRQIADFFEQHPEIALPNNAEDFDYFMAHDRRSLARLARALGSCEKDIHKGSELFQLRHKFGVITFTAFCSKDNVCHRRLVGTEMVPEKVVPASVEPAHERAVYEWDCSGSLLDDSIGGSDGQS